MSRVRPGDTVVSRQASRLPRPSRMVALQKKDFSRHLAANEVVSDVQHTSQAVGGIPLRARETVAWITAFAATPKGIGCTGNATPADL